MQKAKSERAEREMECGQMDRNRDKKTRRAGQWDKQGEREREGGGGQGIYPGECHTNDPY